MKKILLVFEGDNFPHSVFEFARHLNELQQVLLIGLFLPVVSPDSTWSYSYSCGPKPTPLVQTDTSRVVAQHIRIFETACIRQGIAYKVHYDPSLLTLPALIKETRFADLLIISNNFYGGYGIQTPNGYLKMALHDTECPVVLVPENCKFPENVVLAYDGSADAAWAIKSFATLLPELCSKPAFLAYGSPTAKPAMPEAVYIQELVTRHFNNITAEALKSHAEDYLDLWISKIPAPILVCGSFGRSGLSRTFRKSFATRIIKAHKVPVFIAHR